MTDRVMQFKVLLNGINPPIWRQIKVPDNYSFWDLHVAIQDAMGWSDMHLHSFQVNEPTRKVPLVIGLPDDNSPDDILAGWDILIADFFLKEKTTALYVYDFGDNWQHKITFEGYVEPDLDVDYPICTAGERRCPPEDCGGPGGYEQFLKVLNDPNHDDYQDLIESGAEFFDPEEFDPNEVIFDDPEERRYSYTELWDI